MLGVDLSERMLAVARDKNADDNIQYQCCGIEEYEYPESTWDLVISNLALHYIANLDAVFRNVHKTLKPGGIFLFNIEHPVFTAGVNQEFASDGAWSVTDYYYPGERKTNFLGCEITKQHHTLTQILMGLINNGFELEAVEEAMPPEQWRSQMLWEMQRPMMLLVKAKKKSKGEQK